MAVIAPVKNDVQVVLAQTSIGISPSMACWTHSLFNRTPMTIRLRNVVNGSPKHAWIIPYRFERSLNGSYLFWAYAHTAQDKLTENIESLSRLRTPTTADLNTHVQLVLGRIRYCAGGGSFIAPDTNSIIPISINRS
jgi:hypothetical protein